MTTSTYGIPIKLNNFLHSALCSGVTLTVRRLNLSISAESPVYAIRYVNNMNDHKNFFFFLITLIFTQLSCIFEVFIRLFSSFQTFCKLKTRREVLFYQSKIIKH